MMKNLFLAYPLIVVLTLALVPSCATWRAPDEEADIPLMYESYETDRHKKSRKSTNKKTFKSGKKADRKVNDQDIYDSNHDGWGSYYKKDK